MAVDDDATLELTVLAQFISGDTRSKCSLSLDVGSANVAFSPDDAVFLWVYEDDLVGDDLIWETSFTVSSEEVAAGRVERTFDCTGTFETEGEDPGAYAEIYAEARVEKADCGFLCLYDAPETANIDVMRVSDDGREEDDASDAPYLASEQEATDLVARDEDWTRVSLASPGGDIGVVVRFDPGTGPLDVELRTDAGTMLASGSDQSDGARLAATGLAEGDYLLLVSPRDGADPNFYDLVLDANGGGGTGGGCSDGAEDSEPCGNCGVRTRACAGGVWGTFSDCRDQGACGPGSTESAPCGQCGYQTRTCTDTCTWMDGECVEGAGQCVPGEMVTEPCAGGGTHMRACNEGCMWTDVTACDGTNAGVDAGGRPPVDAPSVGCCSVHGKAPDGLALGAFLALLAIALGRRRHRRG